VKKTKIPAVSAGDSGCQHPRSLQVAWNHLNIDHHPKAGLFCRSIATARPRPADQAILGVEHWRLGVLDSRKDRYVDAHTYLRNTLSTCCCAIGTGSCSGRTGGRAREVEEMSGGLTRR